MIAYAERVPRPLSRAALLLTVAPLLVVVALAWWQTVTEARAMSGMLDGLATAGRAMPYDAGALRFGVMWTVMMTAMMLPGVIAVAADRRGPLTGAVVAFGYLVVWALTFPVAYGAVSAFNAVSQPNAWLDRVGGVIIAVAGVYQFTGYHRRLWGAHAENDQIRSAAEAFRVGTSHGLRCLGSSWALMSVLLVVGVMSLVWMAAVSVICLGEKTVTRRATLATGVGLALVALGLLILVRPQTLHVIAETR